MNIEALKKEHERCQSPTPAQRKALYRLQPLGKVWIEANVKTREEADALIKSALNFYKNRNGHRICN